MQARPVFAGRRAEGSTPFGGAGSFYLQKKQKKEIGAKVVVIFPKFAAKGRHYGDYGPILISPTKKGALL